MQHNEANTPANDAEENIQSPAVETIIEKVEGEAGLDTEADELAANEAETDAHEQNPFAELTKQVAEYDDRYKRLYSEFENFRRRTAKERIELITSANAELLKSLLPVVDDMDRAVKAYDATKNTEALAEGLGLVHAKLVRTLEQKGLKHFESKGEPFDAEKHEAITQVPVDEPEMKGKVIDEIEKGYTLAEKVLRFARVVIGA